MRWFTNGSIREEKAGAGVYGPRTEYFEPLDCFSAEAHAIERFAGSPAPFLAN